MPRVKATAKLSSISEFENGDRNGGVDAALNGVLQEKKVRGGRRIVEAATHSKERSKKATATVDIETNKMSAEKLEPVKKVMTGRSKSKKVEDVQSVKIEAEVVKKSAPKSRGKKPAIEPEIVEEPVKPKGRSKIVKSQIKVEETETKKATEVEKGRNRREKTPSVANPVVEPVQKANRRAAPKKELDDVINKETKPAAVASSRGNKKVVDAVLQDPEQALEDGVKVPPKRGAKTKKVVDESVDEEVPKKKKKTTESKKQRAAPKKQSETLSDDVPVKTKTKAVASKSRGQKRAASELDTQEAAVEEVTKSVKSAKSKSKALVNSTESKYIKSDFSLNLSADNSKEEGSFNLKISSWNVAGLRSWLKKDGLKFLEYEEPDIFCMQETKCANDQLPEEVTRLSGYHPYWLCMPGGYAGVAIYSKIMPINVEYGIGDKEFDEVGRMITAEYEKFYLINVYVPNSGRKLVNLELRMRWEKVFKAYVKKLDAVKPVLICGDMNVSYLEIDLANPKSNTRNAGFTKEERDKMSELLAMDMVDTFRHLYPERTGAYTYWTYMANARARNVGWRLDYFIISQRLVSRVLDNCIRSQVMGSDHCPITLFLQI